MPIRMSVKLVGDLEFLGRLGVLKKELEGRRRATMHRAVILIRDEARAHVHSPEGRARRGIRTDVFGSYDRLREVVRSRTVASIFSQRTREPGKRMPPVRRILSWLRRTGQIRSRSSAFLVARAIARRGTRGHPVMQDALDAKRGQVAALFREMVLQALRKR